jgi:DNA-binding IclR family transcriptional regulator
MAELRRLYPEEPLPAYTAKTPTTLAALKQLMDADRAQGYGLSQGGYEAGITTIAAPVLNDQRRVVAAVSITVPAQQLADNQASPLAAMVRQAAEQLSQRLSQLMPAGGRPTTSL